MAWLAGIPVWWRKLVNAPMGSSPVNVGTVDWELNPEPLPEIKHSCGVPMLAVGGARFTENVRGIIYVCLKCHTVFLRNEKEVIHLGDMSDEFVSALVAGELEEKVPVTYLFGQKGGYLYTGTGQKIVKVNLHTFKVVP